MKSASYRRLWAIFFVAVVSAANACTGPTMGQSEQVPPEQRALVLSDRERNTQRLIGPLLPVVARGRHLRFEPTVPRGEDYSEQRLHNFDEALEKLSQALTNDPDKLIPEDQTTGIVTNLYQIALYKHHHPEVFDKLIDHYTTVSNPGAVAPRPPSLVKDDLKHRLVWEYFLLAPETPQMAFMGDLPIKALVVGGHENSLPVLRYMFKLDCAHNFLDSPFRRETGRQFFEAILSFRSKNALNDAFECTHVAEQLQEVHGPPWQLVRTQSRTPHANNREDFKSVRICSFRELLAFNLSAPNQPSDQPSWLPILQAYGLEQLDAKDRELIQQALASYESWDKLK